MDSALHPTAAEARRIAGIIQSARIPLTNETRAHARILEILGEAGLCHEAEVRLSAGERIDAMAGAVGLEIKIRQPRRQIHRQLVRYAALPEIKALVLATATAWPRGIDEIEGVPLVVADLSRGWL